MQEFGIIVEGNIINFLDFNPPLELLYGLSKRTGFDWNTIRSMTAHGYVPLLIDTLDNGNGEIFNEYISQFTVLIQKAHRLQRRVLQIPWLNITRVPTLKGCPDCVNKDAAPYLRLYWQLLWMSSCPKHGIFLEPVQMYVKRGRGLGFIWPKERHLKPAPDSLLAMDHITLQAVTEGTAKVPFGKIHAGLWLRILRTVIEELSSPSTCLSLKEKKFIRSFWNKINLPFRYNLGRWGAFEGYSEDLQHTLMHVASVVFEAIFSRQKGFPPAIIDRLAAAPINEKDLVSYNPTAIRGMYTLKKERPVYNIQKQLDALLEAMRTDPEEVKYFRCIVTPLGASDDDIRKIDDYLESLGIPVKHVI